MGIKKLKVVNDSQMQDGMKNKWESSRVAETVDKYIKENEIKGIFTFDNRGISGHPNHIDVYRGVKHLLETNTEHKDLKVYSLETVNILRKYLGILEFFISAFLTGSNYIYVNLSPLVAWRAMEIHHSQFVWFRKLFVIFSRYAYINVLVKLK